MALRGTQLSFGLVSFAILAGVSAQDYIPAKCKSALPYEGVKLYAKKVELPLNYNFKAADFNGDTVEQLDLAMKNAMKLTKASHMSASIATAESIWHATRSTDDTQKPKSMYWASVGKAFTAVIIMQLAEEGKLHLTDPVSRWIPDLPNGTITTVDHLLLHTSGLFSANEDVEFRKAPRYLTPKEHVRISVEHGAMFCPGQNWRYSNTGYTILGDIIEAIEGLPYHEVVNRRIAKPLKLSTLRALAPQESPPDVAPLIPTDGTQPVHSPSWGYASGSVVSSAEDMLLFWHAFLSAKILTPENTSRMFDEMYPMFGTETYYGRGVMLYKLPDQENGAAKTWLGHSGGTPGAKAVVAYSTHERAFIAVALSGDGSAEASANLLLKVISKPK
ncbi:MAG: beta-lactamase family protein [Undibacterium sp.]|nr:beta-lactamase family protein [Undibacterium sp.]